MRLAHGPLYVHGIDMGPLPLPSVGGIDIRPLPLSSVGGTDMRLYQYAV